MGPGSPDSKKIGLWEMGGGRWDEGCVCGAHPCTSTWAWPDAPGRARGRRCEGRYSGPAQPIRATQKVLVHAPRRLPGRHCAHYLGTLLCPLGSPAAPAVSRASLMQVDRSGWLSYHLPLTGSLVKRAGLVPTLRSSHYVVRRVYFDAERYVAERTCGGDARGPFFFFRFPFFSLRDLSQWHSCT